MRLPLPFFRKKPKPSSVHGVSFQFGEIVVSGSDTVYTSCIFKGVTIRVEPRVRLVFIDCVFFDCDIDAPPEAFSDCRSLTSDDKDAA
jgi:hypothetical protein